MNALVKIIKVNEVFKNLLDNIYFAHSIITNEIGCLLIKTEKDEEIYFSKGYKVTFTEAGIVVEGIAQIKYFVGNISILIYLK